MAVDVDFSADIHNDAEVEISEGYIGPGVRIERGVSIKADYLKIGRDTLIRKGVSLRTDHGVIGYDNNFFKDAEINVKNLVLGNHGVVFARAIIEGSEVRLGHGFYIDTNAVIGGGSAFDPESSLRAGDFYHQGKNSQVNTGRGVIVGHEFGCGMGTNVFTHGAYLSVWEGFPVQWGPVNIGNRVWLPNALVMPGVTIGNDVVVGAGSLVSRDISSGSLAVGSPAVVKKANAYPRNLSDNEKDGVFGELFLKPSINLACMRSIEIPRHSKIREGVYDVGGVVFDIDNRTLEGKASDFSEILRNQMRRNGTRFWYEINSEGMYASFAKTSWD